MPLTVRFYTLWRALCKALWPLQFAKLASTPSDLGGLFGQVAEKAVKRRVPGGSRAEIQM